MPLTSDDLVLYASQNMPTDDTSQSGGAIDTTMRMLSVRMTATSSIELVSDGADTRQATVTARRPDGTVASETLTLNGTTPVQTSESYESLLRVILSSTSPDRTVTVSQVSPSQVLHRIAPGERGATSVFVNAASDSAQETHRYEKVFWKNIHSSAALLEATVMLAADPAGTIQVGLEGVKDGSGSVPNRKTAPDGVDFVDDNVPLPVPGGQLNAGEAIGVWVRLDLRALHPPVRSRFTLRISGLS